MSQTSPWIPTSPARPAPFRLVRGPGGGDAHGAIPNHSWGQGRGDAANRGMSNRSSVPPGATERWGVVPGPLGTLPLGTPFPFGARLYLPVETGDGTRAVAALGKADGAPAWAFRPPPPFLYGGAGQVACAVEMGSGRTLVYAGFTSPAGSGLRTLVLCLRDEGASARILWSRTLEGSGAGQLTLSPGQLVFPFRPTGSPEQGLACLNAADGSTRFLFSERGYSVPDAKVAVDAPLHRIYALLRPSGPGCAKVVALDGRGRKEMEIPLEALVFDIPLVADPVSHRLYVPGAGGSGSLRCYDARGGLLWDSAVSVGGLFPYVQVPVVWRGKVFFVARSSGDSLERPVVAALAADTGEVAWKAAGVLPGHCEPRFSLALAGRSATLWVNARASSGIETFLCLNAQSGQLRGRLAFGTGTGSPRDISLDDDSLYWAEAGLRRVHRIGAGTPR